MSIRFTAIARCDLVLSALLSQVLQLDNLVALHPPILLSHLPVLVHRVVICVPATHALRLVEALLDPLLLNFRLNLLFIYYLLVVAHGIKLSHDVCSLLQDIVSSPCIDLLLLSNAPFSLVH